MAIIGFLSLALLSLSSVHSAPISDARSVATCVRRYSGQLTTSGFVPLGGDDYVFPTYCFNSKGEIAYDKENPLGHPPTYADYQACSSNYAQESNPDPSTDGIVYGRFYIPSLDKCLAVTNSDAQPPYFLGTAPCPSDEDMLTEKSIPFNFVSDETGGVVDMRWIGSTIPKQGKYQGSAENCGGQYYINATTSPGHDDFSTLGEPITDASDDYRVHLYCPFIDNEGRGTGRNSFLVPPYNKTESS